MQIDWWTLVLQTINFVVVVWLLSRFLYRPVRRIIEDREAADRRAAEDAEARAMAAEAARKNYEDKLAALNDAERERDAAFHARLETERNEALAKAQSEASRLMAETHERIGHETDAAVKAVRKDIVGLAAAIARKALSERPATPEAEIAAVAGYIDGLAENEREDLKRDLETSGAGLTLIFTAEPDEALRTAWREMLEERFGSGLEITFRTDTDLLGGQKLCFPHAVLDFSVTERLERAVSEAEE